MNQQIETALTADGRCAACDGCGRDYSRDGIYTDKCSICDGSGRDPLALLRAVQAIGMVQLEILRQLNRLVPP